MALLPEVFRSEDVEADEFSLLPVGKYLAQVVKSEIKETKSGTGKYISLQLKIVDGDYAGRVVFDNINFINANDIAQKIGQQQLKALSEACGIVELEDTAELHAIPIVIQVGIEPAKGQWPEKNRIKKYLPDTEYAG